MSDQPPNPEAPKQDYTSRAASILQEYDHVTLGNRFPFGTGEDGNGVFPTQTFTLSNDQPGAILEIRPCDIQQDTEVANLLNQALNLLDQNLTVLVCDLTSNKFNSTSVGTAGTELLIQFVQSKLNIQVLILNSGTQPNTSGIINALVQQNYINRNHISNKQAFRRSITNLINHSES